MGTALSTFGVTPGFACVGTSGHLIAVMYSCHSLPLALAILSFKSASALYTNGSVIAPCSSPLYCQGEILRQIELAQPYEEYRSEAMAALMWDEEQFAYFDWNLTSNSRHIYEPLDSDATSSQIDDAPAG